MRDGEERDAVKLDALDSRLGVENHIEEHVPTRVRAETHRDSAEEPTDRSGTIHRAYRFLCLSSRQLSLREERNHNQTRQ